MSAKTIIEKTNSLALPIIEGLGLTHVDTEYVKEGSSYYLRIFIDKPGGVNINDCVAVTEPMNELLDKENFIKDPYIFEVSSPGLDRPIKTDKDYERVMGLLLEIKLFAPEDGEKEFVGELISFDSDECVFNIDGNNRTFKRDKLALVRQYIEF